MIVKTRKDIRHYVENSPEVLESKSAYDDDVEWKEIEDELVKVIMTTDGCPEFGEDWAEWLDDNIDEMLQEAISIVM
jgi:hypothetical protein